MDCYLLLRLSYSILTGFHASSPFVANPFYPLMPAKSFKAQLRSCDFQVHIFSVVPQHLLNKIQWHGTQAFSWSNPILDLSHTITPKTLQLARRHCLFIHIIFFYSYYFFWKAYFFCISTNFYLSFKAQLHCCLYYKAFSSSPARVGLSFLCLFYIFYESWNKKAVHCLGMCL